MNKILSTLLAVGMVALTSLTALPAQADEGGAAWDKFPTAKLHDQAALQHGAKLFVNYCLNCHQASMMRYTRLTDLGLTEAQIKDNLVLTGAKIGETMKTSLDPKQAKAWFGAVPPDLSVIERSRAGAGGSGSDYLYSYLRDFYRDPGRATGWNNLVFPNVGMPHALWELQGQQRAKFVARPDPADPAKSIEHFEGFEQITPGTRSKDEYDSDVGDLVAYLTWMAEPGAQQRIHIGMAAMVLLALFAFVAYRLNKAYWKDIH